MDLCETHGRPNRNGAWMRCLRNAHAPHRALDPQAPETISGLRGPQMGRIADCHRSHSIKISITHGVPFAIKEVRERHHNHRFWTSDRYTPKNAIEFPGIRKPVVSTFVSAAGISLA